LIAGVFLLSLSEAALVAVSRVRLRRLADEGDRPAAAVLRVTETPVPLSAIIVAINILIITISCLATLLVKRGDHALGDTAVRLIILGIILVAAEITPKSIGAAHATAVSRWVIGPVRALTWLMSPIVTAVTAAAGVVLRGAGMGQLHLGHFVTKEDLRAAVDVGEEEEVLEPDEGEMFDTALELAKTSVRRIMVPRVDVVALDTEASLEQALSAVQDSGFSRIPVYEGDIDHIVGVLYANDLLGELRAGTAGDSRSGDTMRPALVVPETTPVYDVFREMRDKQVHIAVVVGQRGGTEGIVTIEDILEELVGDIEDEHDTPGEEIQRLGANEALVAPKARIDEVNAELGLALPSDDYETLAGYVAGETGRIPEHGETVRVGPLEVTVEGERDAPRLHVRVVTDQNTREGGDR
jgi:CBS domain containing-hemolysin-like protein